MTVYFISSGDRIKIGFSKNVERRIAALTPYVHPEPVLIGTIVGEKKVEQAIHAHLAAYRLNNEWFRDCDEVRRSIRNFILADKNIEPEVKFTRHVRHLRAQEPASDREYCRFFGALVEMIWPEEPLRRLAEFTERSELECKLWLAGKSVPPPIVRGAFATQVVQWMFE